MGHVAPEQYRMAHVWVIVFCDHFSGPSSIYSITTRKPSLWRLCFHRCLSVHRGDVCPIACWDTPPGPEADTPSPRGRHPLPSACWDTHTHMRSACWDTVNKRALRIPLECILVIDGMAHLVHLTLFYIQFLKEWIQIPIPLLHLAVGIGIWIRRCIVGKVLNITI